jgi:hypothetical protein
MIPASVSDRCSHSHNQSHIQLRPILIIASNQQGDTKRSGHDTLFSISTLTKPQCEVANCLCAGLYAKWLVIVEGVVLRLDPGVFNHGPSVGL